MKERGSSREAWSHAPLCILVWSKNVDIVVLMSKRFKSFKARLSIVKSSSSNVKINVFVLSCMFGWREFCCCENACFTSLQHVSKQRLEIFFTLTSNSHLDKFHFSPFSILVCHANIAIGWTKLKTEVFPWHGHFSCAWLFQRLFDRSIQSRMS